VSRVLAHYEQQSDDEAVAEDEVGVRVHDAYDDGSTRRPGAGRARATGEEASGVVARCEP
jgi:hypothetical protein